MSDDEDYAIESTDAGASATIPMEAGQVKKGGYVFGTFCHANESGFLCISVEDLPG